MRSIRLGVAMLLLLAANTFTFPQSVTAWYIIAAPSFGKDSCQVVKSTDQLRDILASDGWARDGHLPAFDQKSTMVLLTSADQFSKPNTISLSNDGTQALISFARSDQRNSGVFLLAIDGQIGSKNTCNFPQLIATTRTNTTTTTETTKTKSTTRARPQ